MDHFHYRNRVLHCEEVPVADLAAKYGTPLFVYSQATLLHHLKQVQTAFAPAAPAHKCWTPYGSITTARRRR